MIKKFDEFTLNENSQDNLDVWRDLMDMYDLRYFSQYRQMSKSDIEQMREEWKVMRRNALSKLNKELNDSGKSGQLLNIDVSDDELYPYVDSKYKSRFFKYSRILDFSDGYKPKNIIVIKNLANDK